jgi:selenide,water dikinase
MDAAVLAQVLRELPKIDDPNVLVGSATADDAGVYQLSDELALVQTVDFFTPIVDDPRQYGQIAAANALSDIYAMGARPIAALAIGAFPESMDASVIAAILGGGAEKAREAGIAIIGGHTIKDDEPKYGLAVSGVVHPGKIWRNNTGKPGDALVLTKPIGTGILTTARRNDEIDDGVLQPAIDSMLMLNREAAEIAARFEVHAATDVTGFGLIGHLCEMTSGGTGAEISAHAVTLFGEVERLAQTDAVPGGTRTNYRLALESGVQFSQSVSEARRLALCDAQTSGGLLLAVPPERSTELVHALKKAGLGGASEIGSLTPEPVILVVD